LRAEQKRKRSKRAGRGWPVGKEIKQKSVVSSGANILKWKECYRVQVKKNPVVKRCGHCDQYGGHW
jgi:hypothetical protein